MMSKLCPSCNRYISGFSITVYLSNGVTIVYDRETLELAEEFVKETMQYGIQRTHTNIQGNTYRSYYPPHLVKEVRITAHKRFGTGLQCSQCGQFFEIAERMFGAGKD